MTTVKTYRFKFCDSITSILNEFSKLHIHEDREDYNHNWELWLLENYDIIKREQSRLLGLGYEGDINQKLYKSARYYYSKKKQNYFDTNQKQKRRQYVSVSSEFLQAIDNHINNIVKISSLSPAEGYEDFCKKNQILLSTEIITMSEENDFDKIYISSKLKKTYKNRYFYLLKLIK